MKKLLMFLSILLMPFTILAKDYELTDINIKMNIEDDYIVLTRNNLEKNNDLSKLNITKETMEELMNKNNIYFDIIKKDVSSEILVIVPKAVLKINNLVNVDDKILDDLRGELVKKTGAKVSDVYKTKHNYILVDYYDANTGYYIVNYYTIVNAKGYNIQLQKKATITDEEKASLRKIVDSTEIKVLDEYKEESQEIQKQIDNYGKNKNSYDFSRIIYGAIIGAAAGLISYFIGILIKKKKSS